MSALVLLWVCDFPELQGRTGVRRRAGWWSRPWGPESGQRKGPQGHPCQPGVEKSQRGQELERCMWRPLGRDRVPDQAAGVEQSCMGKGDLRVRSRPALRSAGPRRRAQDTPDPCGSCAGATPEQQAFLRVTDFPFWGTQDAYFFQSAPERGISNPCKWRPASLWTNRGTGATVLLPEGQPGQ